ncbi:MAG: hypothetical protein LBB48_09975 [Treponema sp.]|nr:hypothetical protein [Treponema sp.]
MPATGPGRGGVRRSGAAFYGDPRLEPEEYADALAFEAERQLGGEPPAIDAVIVKKHPGVKIEKHLGRIFRERNIIGYESSGDSLTAGDFHKGLA